MTDKDRIDEGELDRLLAGAADNAPAPSQDLMARIMADADGVADGFAPAVPEVSSPVRPGFFATLMKSVGGWPAMAGLATATVAGIWIGYGTPEALNDLSAGYLGASYDLGDFMPSINLILEEG